MKLNIPIEKCDVAPEDRPALESYRSNLNKWRHWLSDDDHSIWNQIFSLATQEVAFRVVNEIRRIGEENPRPGIGQNDMVADLFNFGFVAFQSAAIRRLVDDTGGVRSLRKLVQDIRRNKDAITRENFVCYDGLPYETRDLWRQWLARDVNSNNPKPTVSQDDVHKAMMRHNHFDRLCGKTSDNRDRKDKIQKKWFKLLEAELDKCKDVKTYADHYISHIGNPDNKENLSEDEKGITLAKIAECGQAITKVASGISGPILNQIAMGSPMPQPQYDVFKNIELPWIHPEDKPKLYVIWDKLKEERDNWHNGSWPLLTKEEREELAI